MRIKLGPKQWGPNVPACVRRLPTYAQTVTAAPIGRMDPGITWGICPTPPTALAADKRRREQRS
jgi:hypothetical protein